MTVVTDRAPDEAATALLALHGVRLLGYADHAAIAALAYLDPTEVRELLLDGEAHGWVRRTTFGGNSGWSITDLGRLENERALAAELDRLGTRAEVEAAHDAFLPLNERLGQLMTRWQIRPTRHDASAANDHRDARYDDEVVRGLGRLLDDLRPVTAALTEGVPRFGIHQRRLDHAMTHARSLRKAWVDAPDRPSVNLAWIALHEDLLATLGIPRDG